MIRCQSPGVGQVLQSCSSNVKGLWIDTWAIARTIWSHQVYWIDYFLERSCVELNFLVLVLCRFSFAPGLVPLPICFLASCPTIRDCLAPSTRFTSPSPPEQPILDNRISFPANPGLLEPQQGARLWTLRIPTPVPTHRQQIPSTRYGQNHPPMPFPRRVGHVAILFEQRQPLVRGQEFVRFFAQTAVEKVKDDFAV